MAYKESKNEAVLPLSVYLGTKANLFNDRMAVYSHLNEQGVHLGAEVLVEQGLFVRGSSNFKHLNLGTGVIFEDIPTGIANYNIRGRLDFNYHQPSYPMHDDPMYSISIASLGRSIPKQPEILFPKEPVTIAAKRSTRFSGIGPAETTIRIYNNGVFSGTTLTDLFGNWSVNPYPLLEGENKLVIQSYDLARDFSQKSESVLVVSDTTPPVLEVTLSLNKDDLVLTVSSNEQLATLAATYEGQRLILDPVTRPTKRRSRFDVKEKEPVYHVHAQYRTTVPLPASLQSGQAPPVEMSQLRLFAKDESGNETAPIDYEFFATVLYPLDEHVHYQDMLSVLGYSSALLQSLTVNDQRVYLDEEARFSVPVSLEPGKNSIPIRFQINESDALTYPLRVLRLVTYPDLNPRIKGRREIEFLSTLGVLIGDDDGRFYPDNIVTRQYISKVMVQAMTLPVDDALTMNVFDDVPSTHPYAPYIQAGVNNGLVFAFPDGLFRPEQPLTISEIIYLLSNAGLIDFEEVDNGDDEITRAQLAEFLAYTARFEGKINTLIDWEKGYNGSNF